MRQFHQRPFHGLAFRDPRKMQFILVGLRYTIQVAAYLDAPALIREIADPDCGKRDRSVPSAADGIPYTVPQRHDPLAIG